MSSKEIFEDDSKIMSAIQKLEELCSCENSTDLKEQVDFAIHELKTKGLKASIAITKLIRELRDCRNPQLPLILVVAIELEPTSELVEIVRSIISIPNFIPRPEKSRFLPEIFKDNLMGWTNEKAEEIKLCAEVTLNALLGKMKKTEAESSPRYPVKTQQVKSPSITPSLSKKEAVYIDDQSGKEAKEMTTETYFCPNCKKSIELSAKPKRSFLGFQRIPCLSCQKEFRYPLTAGYVVFYWIVLAGNVVWITYAFSQGGVVIPNPIGIVFLIFVIISLVKNSALKQQIAELQKTVSEQ